MENVAKPISESALEQETPDQAARVPLQNFIG